MSSENKKVDRFFLGIVTILILAGIAIFVSASLGILAKNEAKFYGVLLSQLAFGLGGGIVALIACLKIDYQFWRKKSFYLFLASIILTLLVFVPHLGFSHGGARRWIALGPMTFQPVEFLKIGFIFYFAAWLSSIKSRTNSFVYGILPLIVLLSVIALVLFRQPDTKSFILMIVTGVAMALVSGIRVRYILGLILFAICTLGILVLFKPYLLERVKTFIDPSQDTLGSSYQLDQGLIAVGSGRITGRGFGQSIQKFSYLPEPQGDSIFAVVGEEFGFIGGTILIFLFVAFGMRGMKVARRAPDSFGRLLATGLVIMITAQSFMNIASIVGVFPLTGVPLVFVSQGGTSLLLSLAMVGILLNISQFQKKQL